MKKRVIRFFVFLMVFAIFLTLIISFRWGSPTGYFELIPSTNNEKVLEPSIAGFLLTLIIFVLILGFILRTLYNNYTKESIPSLGHERKFIPIDMSYPK